MVFKFEIDTNKLNDSNPEAVKQTIEDFKMIIQVLCNSNPDYYIIGGMLKEQMEKQVWKMNPKQDMIIKWEMILERDTGSQSREDYVSLYDGIRDLVDQFFNNIGEAMGPVCYAGYLLMQELKKRKLPVEWVENCITYYQNNWDFQEVT